MSALPGTRRCVHLPAKSRAVSLASVLAISSGVDCSRIHVASLPRRDYLFPKKSRPTLPAEWLAAKTHTTVSNAKMAISSLPIHVPKHFPHMPLAPLRFLSFLAALFGDPRILIYESQGMNARDRYLLHEFATARYPDGALVHCWSSNDPSCQLAPNCCNLNPSSG